MKKLSIASSVLLALSMQVAAEPGKKGDTWVAGFGEYYLTDKQQKGLPNLVDNGVGIGAEAGFRFTPEWAARLEVAYLELDGSTGNSDQSGNRLGVDLMYFLPEDLFYVFGGLKRVNIRDNSNVFNYGVGKQWGLNDKWKVVTELATYWDLDNGFTDIGLKLGFAYALGDSPAPVEVIKDSDGDGVNDPADMCPNTLAGTAVDSKGCDIDSDKDGVLNAADMCPNTPFGTKVDSTGCNQDTDGDGVLNSLDACPNTPAGTAVGAKGCSLVLDSDEDGVLDSDDKCANTPITDKVDSIGCSIFMDEEVSQNLTVNFANNSAVISNPDNLEFQKFADFMQRFPNTDTVIEGHASAAGNDNYNMKLSQRRADAVRNLLISKYGIAAERITAKGFGETQLLDTSNTPEADALNRRITAKVSASTRVKVTKE